MNEIQRGFIFKKDLCIQCHGCEMACKMWRETEKNVSWRRVLNLWSGTYPQVTCTALSISCLHCSEPACAEACPTGAITKQDTDGLVIIDKALCTGCRACLNACPYDVPQFGTNGLMQKCDMCTVPNNAPNSVTGVPPCARTCPTGALELVLVGRGRKIEAEQEILDLYKKAKQILQSNG